MNTKAIYLWVFILGISLSACDDDDNPTPDFDYEFGFVDEGADGWEVDFADYPPNVGTDYDFDSEFTTLPEPLDTTVPALRISGTNRSDDLFMFAKRKLTNLPANQTFEVRIEASFASDAASNAVGIGGPPGESVYIKAGVIPEEPTVSTDSMGWLRADFDKGNQSQIGAQAVSLGTAANGTDEFEYVLLDRDAESTMTLETDENGEAWLYIGSDSGFEGTTTLYYRRIWVYLDMQSL